MLADVPARGIGALAGANLTFVVVTARPGVGGINPRECVVVLAGVELAEHYCDADGEFLPHESPCGYLALPVGADVTFVRVTICAQRYWEAPVMVSSSSHSARCKPRRRGLRKCSAPNTLAPLKAHEAH